jgi:nucleotide-binding universal stress UspA family protein
MVQTWGMSRGPIVIGYEGSSAAKRAVNEAAKLFAGRKALVVTVWEPGLGLIAMEHAMPVVPVDISSALEVDEEQQQHALQIANQGAELARRAGLDAEALAVADESTVADTLVKLVEQEDAIAVVVGSHGHKAVKDVFVATTTRAVIQKSSRPVVVVRDR